MKYALHAYADAFLSLLEKHPDKKDEIVRGFARMLQTSGDAEGAAKVIACVEEKMAQKEGRVKIKIYSARVLPDALVEKIKDVFGKNALVRRVIAPDVIAGVKIVVNDEIMIDATLKKKLELITK